MTGKRDWQPGKYGYAKGAIGDVDSVGLDEDGWAITLIGHDLEYKVTTVETDNGPEITHLAITGDRPITTDDLRRIPLRRLAFAAARVFDNINASNSQWLNPERAQQRPHQYDDEHFQAIARAARNAFAHGLRVRDTIARDEQVSTYTVDKWLAECRKRGYLKRGDLQRRKKPTPDNPKKGDTNA